MNRVPVRAERSSRTAACVVSKGCTRLRVAHTLPQRAAIHSQVFGRCFVTAVFLERQTAIPPQEFLGRQRDILHCLPEASLWISRRLYDRKTEWLIPLPNENVSHALFQLANVSRPWVLLPEVLVDPLEHLVGQFVDVPGSFAL